MLWALLEVAGSSQKLPASALGLLFPCSQLQGQRSAMSASEVLGMQLAMAH